MFAMTNLGKARMEVLHDYEGALMLFQTVLSCEVQHRGELHDKSLRAATNLAYAHMNMGNHEEALALHNFVLEANRDMFGHALASLDP